MSSIELAQSADAHCRAFLVQTAYEMTKDLGSTASASLVTVIHQFIELYAVDTCMKAIGDLIRVSFVQNFLTSKGNSDLHPSYMRIIVYGLASLKLRSIICPYRK